jgi:threonine dehydrogenase-like Zn-dependent dehydrogenase
VRALEWALAGRVVKATCRMRSPQVTHGGVCHSDIHMVDNDWFVSQFPFIPGGMAWPLHPILPLKPCFRGTHMHVVLLAGHEVVGVVRAVGAEVRAGGLPTLGR